MAAINKLTEIKVQKGKPKDKSYRLADGGGMYLEVMPNGSKYWRMKYRFGGKEKRLAFGVYPIISLATAREKSRLAKAQLREDHDLGELKKTRKMNKQISTSNTFSAIADAFIQKRGAASVTIEKLRWIIEQKLGPFIGKVPVSEITAVKLLAPLRHIESEGLHVKSEYNFTIINFCNKEVTIDEVELRLGLNIMPSLSSTIQAPVERGLGGLDWVANYILISAPPMQVRGVQHLYW